MMLTRTQSTVLFTIVLVQSQFTVATRCKWCNRPLVTGACGQQWCANCNPTTGYKPRSLYPDLIIPGENSVAGGLSLSNTSPVGLPQDVFPEEDCDSDDTLTEAGSCSIEQQDFCELDLLVNLELGFYSDGQAYMEENSDGPCDQAPTSSTESSQEGSSEISSCPPCAAQLPPMEAGGAVAITGGSLQNEASGYTRPPRAKFTPSIPQGNVDWANLPEVVDFANSPSFQDLISIHEMSCRRLYPDERIKKIAELLLCPSSEETTDQFNQEEVFFVPEDELSIFFSQDCANPCWKFHKRVFVILPSVNITITITDWSNNPEFPSLSFALCDGGSRETLYTLRLLPVDFFHLLSRNNIDYGLYCTGS